MSKIVKLCILFLKNNIPLIDKYTFKSVEILSYKNQRILIIFQISTLQRQIKQI